MAITDQLKKLVDQLPAPNRNGMLLENMDDAAIEKTATAIAEGGAENMLGLIEMLDEPGTAENVKPHYAIHCVLNHTLITKDETLRKTLCEAIGSQLGNRDLHPTHRAYLCQELQWAGRDESCAALGEVLLDEEVTDDAATALVAIGGERAASQLRGAVAKATGKAKLNLIDALAALAEPKSADTLTAALGDANREVRIAAALGLANLGQVAAVDALLKLADSGKGWERTQTTKACLVLAERLAAAGKPADAKRIYDRLKKTRTADNESHIRDAAEIGLAAIA